LYGNDAVGHTAKQPPYTLLVIQADIVLGCDALLVLAVRQVIDNGDRAAWNGRFSSGTKGTWRVNNIERSARITGSSWWWRLQIR